MRDRRYTKELKESILNEVKEVGNVSLVSRKHGISKSTIFTWIKNSKQKDKIKEYILEAIDGEAINYGYRKIMHHLRREYGLIINHKKVYRLCKELDILKNQRVIKPKVKRSIAVNRIITGSNQLW